MKILIIHNQYKLMGGEYAAVKAQIELLQMHGHDVILYQRDNAEIDHFNLFQRIGFLFSSVYSFQTIRDLNKIIKEYNPQVVHIHNVFPLISPSVYTFLGKKGIPIIQTIHNFRFMCPNGLFYINGKICERCKFGNTMFAVAFRCYHGSYLLSGLYALVIGLHRKLGTFNSISCFIALNEFSKQKMIESKVTDERKIRVIPNFITLSGTQKKEVKRGNTFLFLGRLSEEKGIQDLINCAKKYQNLEITIVGTGPIENELIESSVEISQRITFTGYLSGSKKQEVIDQALAIIPPSKWYEQFPITALEAMLAGKPLIVPNLGSWPFIVEDGETGLLYTPGDIDDLAGKMNLLLNHPELATKMGEKARHLIREQFSDEAIYTQLMSVYESFLPKSCI